MLVGNHQYAQRGFPIGIDREHAAGGSYDPFMIALGPLQFRETMHGSKGSIRQALAFRQKPSLKSLAAKGQPFHQLAAIDRARALERCSIVCTGVDLKSHHVDVQCFRRNGEQVPVCLDDSIRVTTEVPTQRQQRLAKAMACLFVGSVLPNHRRQPLARDPTLR